jgi:predicted  nucleic acid-binding Zn-ribbon protein
MTTTNQETSQETFDSEIDRLAALQNLDCQLKEQADQEAALLREAEEFELLLLQRRAELAQLVAQQTTLDAQRAELDTRVDTEGGKLRDNRMRINRVRTERELSALQREIDLGKEANQLLEEQLIGVMVQLEELGTRVTASATAVEELQARVAEEVTARRERAKELRGQRESERENREALVRGMNPALRSKYEQIFERRGGTAVVAVLRGVCMGCRMSVPPQMFNELQKFRDIRQCPNCHRILYYRPEPQVAAQ